MSSEVSTPDLGLALGLPGLPLTDSRALAARAEAVGTTTIAVGELNYDSFASAAYLAAGTTTARILTGVTTWVRPPVLTATAAMTVSEIASGRFVLGLGTMPASYNRDYYGLDPSRPVARLREYVAVVRATMASTTTDAVDFAGEFYSVNGYCSTRTTVPEYTPPVHLAATRTGMARLAGEIADGVLFNIVHTVDWLREEMVPALNAGAAGNGRQVERGVMLRVVPVDGSVADRERGMAHARQGLSRYLTVPYFRDIAAARGHDPDRLDDQLVNDFVAIGTTEELKERCAAYAGLVDWIEIVPVGGLSPEQMRTNYDQIFEGLLSS